MTRPFDYRLIPLLARLIRYCLSISAHASPTCSRFLIFSPPPPPPFAPYALLRVSSRSAPTTIDCPLGRPPSINLIIPALIGDFYPRPEESICFVFLQKASFGMNGRHDARRPGIINCPTLSNRDGLCATNLTHNSFHCFASIFTLSLWKAHNLHVVPSLSARKTCFCTCLYKITLARCVKLRRS